MGVQQWIFNFIGLLILKFLNFRLFPVVVSQKLLACEISALCKYPRVLLR